MSELCAWTPLTRDGADWIDVTIEEADGRNGHVAWLRAAEAPVVVGAGLAALPGPQRLAVLVDAIRTLPESDKRVVRGATFISDRPLTPEERAYAEQLRGDAPEVQHG